MLEVDFKKKYADVENKFINAVRLEKLVNVKTGYIGNIRKKLETYLKEGKTQIYLR